MKIQVTLSIGYPTAQRSAGLEVDDDATPEMIQEVVQDWADTCIDLSWKPIK